LFLRVADKANIQKIILSVKISLKWFGK
jgi:hypothetical protein